MVWVLCCGVGIVLWCGYCVVVWVLCCGVRIVLWCGYCVVVWVLCCGVRIVFGVGIVLWCWYCLVSFESFVLRHLVITTSATSKNHPNHRSLSLILGYDVTVGIAEKDCLLSRFHFTCCRYFLGHVACRNLP